MDEMRGGVEGGRFSVLDICKHNHKQYLPIRSKKMCAGSSFRSFVVLDVCAGSPCSRQAFNNV